MAKRKIFLVSPREPSGATWLINCFLELGIKTYRNPQNNMWLFSKGYFCLNPDENILKKWLPILSRKTQFSFNDDIEVEWTHEWPTSNFSQHQVVYFVRDPRDAIFSRYKRENPNQSYREFVEFPDVHTLLDKIDNWCVFNQYWLAFDHIKVFRFEDYKADAKGTLCSVLDSIGFNVSQEKVELAVAESTFEKAAEAERRYLDKHPEDRETINRNGKPGGWREHPEYFEISELIGARSSKLLYRFRYDTIKGGDNNLCAIPRLRFFSNLISNPSDVISVETGASSRVIEFAQKLDLKMLEYSSCRVYEVTQLIESIVEYFICHGIKPCRNLPALYSHYGDSINYLSFIRSLTGNHKLSLKIFLLHLENCGRKRIKTLFSVRG